MVSCTEAMYSNALAKRRVLTSIDELQAAINRFIAETNDKPKPFVWTKYGRLSSPLFNAGGKR